jgi:hypothetical protein
MIDQTFDTPPPVRLDVRMLTADIEIKTVEGTESSVVASGLQQRRHRLR